LLSLGPHKPVPAAASGRSFGLTPLHQNGMNIPSEM
jgi:hypothetical protein